VTTEHGIGTHEEWQAKCDELLKREKELTRLGDELARQRRELPWVPLGSEYTFQTADGPKTLAELFDGRSQLVAYHFMFGPDWEAGCPVCSSIADSFDGVLEHLEARDVTMICISQAPIEKLLAFRERMGWSFNWASSYESDFNRDFKHSSTREEVGARVDQVPAFVSQFASATGNDVAGYLTEKPGLTVFARSGDTVYLAYETTARGLEVVMTYYGILDLVPQGRDERDPMYQSWIRHHDSYAQASSPAAGV
jgi:predicted dithiol-disulfide oxidoreductase (DUF899 family)